MKCEKLQMYPYKCFRLGKEYYVFSSGDNCLLKIDETEYATLTKGEMNEFVITDYNKSFYETSKEFNLLLKEKEGYHFDGTVKHMVLMISQDCNLNCVYCYGDAGEYHNCGKMDIETAKRAIDFLVSHRGDEKYVYVVFFGGEPLMNSQLIFQLVDYMDQIEQTMDIKFGKSMTTNGTMLTSDIVEYCRKKEIAIRISIDGPEEVNDANRCFKGGVGTYRVVMKNTETLRKEGLVSARATITPNEVDQDKVTMFLSNQGFKNIGSAIAHEMFNEEDYFRAYLAMTNGKELIRELLDNCEDNIEVYNQIGFMGYLRTVHQSNDADFGCGAGRKMIAVDINGDVFPCQRFVGVEELKLGNITLNSIKPEIFLDKTYINSTERKKCSKCWIKNLCLGSCAHSSYVNTGDISGNSDVLCAYYKALYMDAICFYVQLTVEEKQVLFKRK